LNHSNLVQVLDLGKLLNQYFLILEFVDGWSLEQIRRRAQQAKMKFPIPLALYVVSALCRGLAYVHTRARAGKPLGIVHRDVTPQNVLITQHGEVKLADFGIAKAVGKSEKSATGVIKGKFAYMSPEQSQARPLDARSDLFSVGTLLYLLTTGRKPFDGPTDLDVIMAVRRARPEKPSTVVRDLNPDVEKVINRALRADPGKRWQSAEQMADRIDAILVKLGQPSGPAPLKRWLEALSAKDGAKPPVIDPAAVSDPSLAVELGSIDLELQQVPPTIVETDRGTGLETRPLRPDLPLAMLMEKVGDPPPPPGAVVRFKRWVRRVTIRTAVVVVALGAAFYFARPHLPVWAKQPIDNWLRRVHPSLASQPKAR
jgi:serine/threonine-protein kinase